MSEPPDDGPGPSLDDEARRARRAARARRIRRRRLMGIVVVLILLAVAGGAIAALAGRGDGDGSGSAATTTAASTTATTTAPAGTTTAPRPARKPRVTVIGDSVSASLLYVPPAVRLLRTGLDLRLDLRECRRLVSPSCPYMGSTPATALEVIETRGDDLGRTVVIDVGYNDASTTYGRDIGEVLGALRTAGVTNVIWVTLAEERSDYATINGIIRSAARRDELMCVADWAQVSRGQPYFGDDGLHLNAAGATAFAKLLRPYALRAGRTGSCRPG